MTKNICKILQLWCDTFQAYSTSLTEQWIPYAKLVSNMQILDTLDIFQCFHLFIQKFMLIHHMVLDMKS